jgi:selenium metabolism protein YedF
MKTVDTRGLKCPKPLIMLKEALQEMAIGDEMIVHTDNETSLKNLVTFLKDQGSDPQVLSEGKSHTIKAACAEKKELETDLQKYCNDDPANMDYVICIKGELMGEGDPELGKVLMETFLDNLKLQGHLPTHVILYNSGVKLAMKQSPVCSSLSELEEMGTRIVLCGTCIDHFGLQYEIGVGMITNMMTITETMASAGHVIYP